jgi:hypothetical protein
MDLPEQEDDPVAPAPDPLLEPAISGEAEEK